MKKKHFLIGVAGFGLVVFLCLFALFAMTNLFGAAKEQVLLQACGNGQISSVKSLIDSGVSADARDGWNTSCMFLAAGNGHTEIVAFLLAQGIDIDERYRMDKTALIVASQGGRMETVRFLASKNANLNLKDTDGKSALDHAVDQKHEDVSAFLKNLIEGADL
ncbi:MAG TPA: hypothetical protein DEP46_12840 [Blastocatellia bacterium]|nr:hypothetical protein [Blastocatellia bacterium]